MDSSTKKRWIVIGAAFVLALALLATCLGGGEAHAATPDEPADGTSFTIAPTPVVTALTGGGASCYQWDFGPWNSTDGAHRLRFGYGERVVACVGKGGNWVSLPTFDPYHYLGYWQHDSTKKSHSQIGGYSFLDLTTVWKFSYKPLGVPLLNKDRTLRCRLTAWDHNANCTLYM